MTRTFFLSCCAVLVLAPVVVQAQSPVEVDAELFRPSTGQGYFAIESARLLQNLKYQGNAFLNFSDGALVALDNNGEVIFEPVERRSVVDVSFALGLFDFLELGVALPVSVAQAGDDLGLLGGGVAISGSSLGDLRLTGKARVLGAPSKKEGFFVSFAPEVKLPTGDGAQFFGGVSPSVLLGAAAEWRSPRVSLGLNAGPRFQQTAAIQDLVIGNQLEFGAAASFLVHKRVSALAELEGVFSFEDDGESPLEARAGAKINLPRGLFIPVGAGLGLSEDVGAPRFRIFAGVAFAPEAKLTDVDEDGLFSDVDKCPKSAEDKDSFEDEDGCPEADNDQDQVADLDDDCPDEPGVSTARGCPDADGDTVANAKDACPDTAGPVNAQGCPDSDADNVADNRDACVSEPEDRDGVRDDDGCPEDNDEDKIADKDDLCPDEAETYNGIKDGDGCPELFASTDPEPIKPVKEPAAGAIGTLYYKTAASGLSSGEKAQLDTIAAQLQADTSIKIRLEGHADDIGTAAENRELSLERARLARRYLLDKGIARDRIKVKGFGETRPYENAQTNEARSKNRRVEVVVISE